MSKKLKKKSLSKLGFSVIIDLVGILPTIIAYLGITVSFGLSLLLEVFDLFWAPISAYLVQKLYNNKILTGIGFIEEILPGTDFVPTATIGWFKELLD